VKSKWLVPDAGIIHHLVIRKAARYYDQKQNKTQSIPINFNLRLTMKYLAVPVDLRQPKISR